MRATITRAVIIFSESERSINLYRAGHPSTRDTRQAREGYVGMFPRGPVVVPRNDASHK